MNEQWVWPLIHDKPNGKPIDEELRRALNKRLGLLQRRVNTFRGRGFFPEDYGPVGTSDDTKALQGAINAAQTANGFVSLDGRTYRYATTLSITSSVRILGNGAQLIFTTASEPGLTIAASNVRLEWFSLTGTQFAASDTDENGIECIGASAASPWTNIQLEGVSVDTWGNAGIWLEWVDGFDVWLCQMEDIYHYGLVGLSVLHGDVGLNRVTNVVGTAPVYGMAFTRHEVDSLTTHPRSTDVLVHDNIIDGVPAWEGLDTHGGKRVHFVDNTVLGCKVGIAMPRADGAGSVPMFAPLDCRADNNIIDSLLTDGTASYGIVLVGVASGEQATGSITGNTVRGHGDETTTTTGGIVIYDGLGVRVQGNTCAECSPHGIVAYARNEGFTITDNTIIDPWSETLAGSAAVCVQLTSNEGTISNNKICVGSKSATYVNERGLTVDNSTGNVLSTYGNDFEAATTPYSGTTNGTKRNFRVIGNVEIGVDDGDGPRLVQINAAAGANRDVQFTTAGVNRWLVRSDATAESGSDAGSSFVILARDDSGNAIDTPLTITRVAGGSVSTPRPIAHAGTHGELWTRGIATESLTLTGLTTDTSANLLPANAIIDAVVWRVTTTITGSALVNYTIGDGTTAARFVSAQTTFTSGQTGVGLQHQQGGVATDAAGPVQSAAAKVRVTVAAGSVSGGVIRLTVYYRQGTAPTS